MESLTHNTEGKKENDVEKGEDNAELALSQRGKGGDDVELILVLSNQPSLPKGINFRSL